MAGLDIPHSQHSIIDFWIKLSLLVGLIAISKTLIRIAHSLLLTFKKPNLKIYGENSWAIITGASEGIGRGYCEELAKLGFNICMVSRSAQKLEKVDQALRKINPKIQTRIIACDLGSSTSSQFYDVIVNRVSDLDVGVLINNVGMVNIDEFHKLDEKSMKQELSLNLLPMTALSRKLIPRMLKRPHKSAIINLSSMSFKFGLKLLAVYNATKAFDDMLSRSIADEHRDKIDVLSLRPLGVTTRMTNFVQHPLSISPNKCAEASLKELGVVDYTMGHISHTLQGEFLTSIPGKLIQIGEKEFYNQIRPS